MLYSKENKKRGKIDFVRFQMGKRCVSFSTKEIYDLPYRNVLIKRIEGKGSRANTFVMNHIAIELQLYRIYSQRNRFKKIRLMIRLNFSTN